MLSNKVDWKDNNKVKESNDRTQIQCALKLAFSLLCMAEQFNLFRVNVDPICSKWKKLENPHLIFSRHSPHEPLQAQVTYSSNYITQPIIFLLWKTSQQNDW